MKVLTSIVKTGYNADALFTESGSQERNSTLEIGEGNP
jgi:hypothetical protein